MANERPSFAYEVVPLDVEPAEDRRERLLGAAEMVANHVVSELGSAVEGMTPLLVAETQGELSAVYWHTIEGYDGGDFMEIVIPATLDSLDADGAALVRFAELIADDVARPALVIYAIDRSAAEQPGITLAAHLREDDAELRLAAFEVLAHGLDPEIARALRRGTDDGSSADF